MHLGEVIKTRRTFRRLSLEKLSVVTGYTVSTLKDIEANNSKPVIYGDIARGVLENKDIEVYNGYFKFCRLADALGFDPLELEQIAK